MQSRSSARRYANWVAVLLTGLCLALAAPAGARPPDMTAAKLQPCAIARDALCGLIEPPVDRTRPAGPTLKLSLVVLPAESATPSPDPIFIVVGGPGIAATSQAKRFENSWMRRARDLVFVDMRGTSADLPLNCPRGDDNDLQGYLDTMFPPPVFRACAEALAKRVDLTQFTSLEGARDLDQARQALGYGTVNLVGSSYGTRATLVYLRMFPASIRAAILNGVAPIAFRNPLYHARGAQQGMDLLIRDCGADAACRAAFPNFKLEFQTLLAQLEKSPAKVAVPHPRTGKPVDVTLTRDGFAEAVRQMLYYADTSRRIPKLIHQAYLGDMSPFAAYALERNRFIRDIVAFGQLMSVICSEDVARIRPQDIAEETKNTFIGDARVREQADACAVWPHTKMPESYGRPVTSDRPVLVLSGSIDPVTTPAWGAEAASHLRNSKHVVAPGGHVVGGPCIDRLEEAFLTSASVTGLDARCVADMQLPPFEL